MSATAVAIRKRPAPALEELKLTADRKVTQFATWEPAAGRWKPAVRNTVGTTAGVSCPGATEWCKNGTCYAGKLEKGFPSVGRLVDRNLSILRGTDRDGMASLYRTAVAQYRTELEKGSRKAGRILPDVFRFKWDGDLFSADEAGAIADTVASFPGTQFWLYTRSFAFVSAFAGLPNVAVYLSVDPLNVSEAEATASAHPWVHFAFCADTWEETEALAYQVTGRNAPRCPELTGKVPMVSPDGTGACVTCGLCIWGRNNVRFAKH